jgi:hypothetical protein
MKGCHFCFRLNPLPALQFHETGNSIFWLELASFYFHREFTKKISGYFDVSQDDGTVSKQRNTGNNYWNWRLFFLVEIFKLVPDWIPRRAMAPLWKVTGWFPLLTHSNFIKFDVR